MLAAICSHSHCCEKFSTCSMRCAIGAWSSFSFPTRRSNVSNPPRIDALRLLFDMETLRGYHTRLLEIDEEIEEAIRFNDPARQEKLGNEREAILNQMKSAQGLGGRVRQQFDAERSRKTVCKAISRAIDAIQEVHPELGVHLHKSINLGLEVRYSPDVVIDWLF